VAKKVFDEAMKEANQIARKRQDVNVTAADLLKVPAGDITEAGVRQNVNVGILYMEAWLRGLGCVPLYNLMEDAATAEISRTQLWQWRKHGSKLKDGRAVDGKLLDAIFDEEMKKIRAIAGDAKFNAGAYVQAADLLKDLVAADELADFLTIPAYDLMVAAGA